MLPKNFKKTALALTASTSLLMQGCITPDPFENTDKTLCSDNGANAAQRAEEIKFRAILFSDDKSKVNLLFQSVQDKSRFCKVEPADIEAWWNHYRDAWVRANFNQDSVTAQKIKKSLQALLFGDVLLKVLEKNDQPPAIIPSPPQIPDDPLQTVPKRWPLDPNVERSEVTTQLRPVPKANRSVKWPQAVWG